ncbi:MAG: hypothetical protein Q4G62_01520 [Pseudomonadota bacterium]|nr:hypothetical protein [Pseudomonadota bacterium]
MNAELTAAADRWYGVHHAEHLARDCDRLIDRCAAHLVSAFAAPAGDARRVAAGVYGDRAARPGEGYIDIDTSTGRIAVIHDTAQRRTYHLSAAELLAYCRQRASPSG